MEYIYGANGSYIRNDRNKSHRRKPTPSTTYPQTPKINQLKPQSPPQRPSPDSLHHPSPISADYIAKKFRSVLCDVDQEHGSYDFICLTKEAPYGRLICIDCFKDSPEKMRFMQKNGKMFMRFSKFLDLISNPKLTSRDFDKLNMIRRMQGKILGLMESFDKNIDDEIENIRDFFERTEDSMVDLVRKAMRRNCDTTIERFLMDSNRVRDKISIINKNCENLTKFGSKGHLVDLSETIDGLSGPNNAELKEKIDDIVDLVLNMDEILSDWSSRLQALGAYPERSLKPRVDLMELGRLFKHKEVVVRDELENFDYFNPGVREDDRRGKAPISPHNQPRKSPKPRSNRKILIF